jgi:hypothetical protein
MCFFFHLGEFSGLREAEAGIAGQGNESLLMPILLIRSMIKAIQFRLAGIGQIVILID